MSVDAFGPDEPCVLDPVAPLKTHYECPYALAPLVPRHSGFGSGAVLEPVGVPGGLRTDILELAISQRRRGQRGRHEGAVVSAAAGNETEGGVREPGAYRPQAVILTGLPDVAQVGERRIAHAAAGVGPHELAEPDVARVGVVLDVVPDPGDHAGDRPTLVVHQVADVGVGDADLALDAVAAGVEHVELQRQAGGVVDVDPPVAVHHLQLAAASVHDRAEQLHVAALHHHVVHLDALCCRVVHRRDVAAQVRDGDAGVGRPAAVLPLLPLHREPLTEGAVDIGVADNHFPLLARWE